MDARSLALAQLGLTKMLAGGALGDCPQSLVNAAQPGKVSTVGQILTHAFIFLDECTNAIAQQKGTLWETGGWSAKCGGGDSHYSPTNLDIAAFREYVDAVFASAESFLTSASDADLDRVVETPLGPQPAVVLVGGLAVVHVGEHVGDVATIKGMSGVQGLPF